MIFSGSVGGPTNSINPGDINFTGGKYTNVSLGFGLGIDGGMKITEHTWTTYKKR